MKNSHFLIDSKNTRREWYKEAVYQIWFESGQWKLMKWPMPGSVIQAHEARF